MVIRVKTPCCKEGWFPSFDLKICTCSMLTLCGSMSLQLFFSPFMPDSWYSFKTCLWSARQGTKESFEKTLTWKKKTHWLFFFNLIYPGLDLRMHMLRIVLLGWPCITSSAWILLWIYLQTSNAFKPILLAVCFAAYCSRYATDMWEKR